jgi:lysyl-tRNA synthetase class 2
LVIEESVAYGIFVKIFSSSMSTHHLSEQEIIRRQKLTELNNLGIDAYPAALFPVNTTSVYIKENYKGDSPETKEEDKQLFAEVCIAGRIMSVRDMGKANFAVLQDGVGKIQFYIKQDDICPDEDKTLYQTVWKKLVDIGDIVGINGYVFTTKTGETSIHVKSFTLLTKSLRPLPIVKEKDGESFDEVTDPEFRYRQRYADLIVNPGVK